MKNDTIMKKGINLFVLATLLSVVGMQMAQAQLTDTVRHRIRNYHYSQWFDTCSCCYNEIEDSPTHLFLREVGSAAEWQEHAYSDYALEPIEILGVNLMAKHEGMERVCRWDDTNYEPEYVHVGYYDSANSQMQILEGEGFGGGVETSFVFWKTQQLIVHAKIISL